MKTYLEIQREERDARESSIQLALKQGDELQRIYAAGVKPNIFTDMVAFWRNQVAEEDAHFRILAALSDAIAITKAEQDGWEVDRYMADRRRLM